MEEEELGACTKVIVTLGIMFFISIIHFNETDEIKYI